MLMPIIAVFIGGGVGAILRELFMLLLGRDSHVFPFDIFAANMLASFLLGLAFGLSKARRLSTTGNLFIATGLCGGMSTFSSFIYGSYSVMTRPGDVGIAILYIVASLIIGFALAWLGLRLIARTSPA